VDFSVVIPAHNEAENIEPLLREVVATLEGGGAGGAQADYEVVVVNDGSTDGMGERLAELGRSVPRLRVVRHAASRGQSFAIATGVRSARGTWIATLDGDGQNDPADLPKLLALRPGAGSGRGGAGAEGPLLIAGYRRKRRDTWLKRVSSRVANGVRGRLLGDRTPDTGCGLKVFEREAFLALPQFDHMHRFLPALFLRAGGRVVSVEVSHRPRARGASHYGMWNRLWVGIVDLVGVWWLIRRRERR
jgi:dolichol-phosphate mannosyltransferase